jgi:hypothetical protein
MAATKAADECQAGIIGYTTTYGTSTPAEFVSEPLKANATIGGPSTFTFYFVDEAQPVFGAYGTGSITYALDAITQDGITIGVAGGDLSEGLITGPTPTKSEYPLVIPGTELPAGSKLRLQLFVSCFCTSTNRMLFGGEFADSGLRMGTGAFKAGATASVPKSSAPKPRVEGKKVLPATGVALSGLGYLLVIGAMALGIAGALMRRTYALG